jgi:hypothetical protein
LCSATAAVASRRRIFSAADTSGTPRARRLAAMPNSASTASITFKDFSGAKLLLPPKDAELGVSTTLRRRLDDATLALTFTEASLREPTSGRGVVLAAEKPLADGVVGRLSYDLAKRAGTAAVTLTRPVAGSDLTMTAVYKQAGDEFILEEAYRIDAANRVAGSYNFASEEALFAYTHTHGPWTATARHNFKKDESTAEVARRAGKAVWAASYCPRDESATLSWAEGALKATAKGRAGRGGVFATQVALQVVHTFDI